VGKYMPVKPNFNPNYLYFVTTGIADQTHLLRSESFKRIILDSFHFLHSTGRIKLFCFVIMPNHIHLIAQFESTYSIADAMRDLKRKTARMIIYQLRAENAQAMLETLRKRNQDDRQEFKVWEDGYDARDIFTLEFLEQKMAYIHHNPCQPHWKLVELPEDYPFSSAGFYLANKPCIIPIDDVREHFA
jgi:putative transposase